MEDNNAYGLGDLGKKRAGKWKGEEHGSSHDRGPGMPREAFSSFCTEEIGYFDPHLPTEYGEGDIVTAGKAVYYPDVHLFVSQVQAIAKVQGSEVIRRTSTPASAVPPWHGMQPNRPGMSRPIQCPRGMGTRTNGLIQDVALGGYGRPTKRKVHGGGCP